MDFLVILSAHPCEIVFFFFNDTATTEIYTLSLHDALPISQVSPPRRWSDSAGRTSRRAKGPFPEASNKLLARRQSPSDRKSTRLNSSHSQISYAVFCLKKKKTKLSVSTTIRQADTLCETWW